MAKKKTKKKKAVKAVKKKAPRRAKAKKSASKKTGRAKAKSVKKSRPKKVVKKKAAKKKAPAKKKAVAHKKTRTAGKPAARRKTRTARKPAAPKKTAMKKAAPKPRTRQAKTRRFTRKELKTYRQLLLNIRDAVVDDISFLKGDNLNHSQRDATGDLSGYSIHMADQGTDNFDREFALNLVSSEHDILYEIDEALRRIDSGTFGICEHTGKPIEKERLKVIPHTRYCVAAQAEFEKGKARYRPFGPTLNQGG